jgi:tripartite-type tricarboxylate transporter receptor subunit TctC
MARPYARLRIAVGLLLALTTAVAATATVAAEDYPTKPVRMIIPFPPGAINDTVGRMIATPLSARLGKQVVVDNRSGAGGVIGTEVAANAPKDGYTILIVSLVNAVNPWLYRLSYDPINSFTPIAVIGSAPNILLVNPELPVKTVPDLIALAKEKPGEVPYASGGVGSFQHLGGELFKLMAGVDLLHVPFKGGGPALIDVLGGHSKVIFATTITGLPHIRSGRLRVLGTGGRERTPVLPDVPTIAETGVPGYEAVNWIGLAAPAGTPPAIVAKLHSEIAAILDSPELQKQFATEGMDVMRMSSAEFGSFMAAEMGKWQRVVKEGGIKAE